MWSFFYVLPSYRLFGLFSHRQTDFPSRFYIIKEIRLTLVSILNILNLKVYHAKKILLVLSHFTESIKLIKFAREPNNEFLNSLDCGLLWSQL